MIGSFLGCLVHDCLVDEYVIGRLILQIESIIDWVDELIFSKLPRTQPTNSSQMVAYPARSQIMIDIYRYIHIHICK